MSLFFGMIFIIKKIDMQIQAVDGFAMMFPKLSETLGLKVPMRNKQVTL